MRQFQKKKKWVAKVVQFLNIICKEWGISYISNYRQHRKSILNRDTVTCRTMGTIPHLKVFLYTFFFVNPIIVLSVKWSNFMCNQWFVLKKNILRFRDFHNLGNLQNLYYSFCNIWIINNARNYKVYNTLNYMFYDLKLWIYDLWMIICLNYFLMNVWSSSMK